MKGMNNLIIIDDSKCKDQLKSFIADNADQVKLFLTEEDYNVDLDSLTEKIHSIVDHKKTVFIKTTDSFLRIVIADIFYIQKEASGLFLHLSDKKSYCLPEKIEHYIHAFGKYGMIQVADNTLINTRFIDSYNVDKDFLYCAGRLTFKVKKPYKEILLNKLNNLK